MSLKSTLSNIWTRFQGELFPELAEEIGPLMEKHKHLVQVLDLVEVERFVDTYWRGPGRPQQSRRALARAFIAKAIWDLYVAVIFMLRWLKSVRLNSDIVGFSATFYLERCPCSMAGSPAMAAPPSSGLFCLPPSVRPTRPIRD